MKPNPLSPGDTVAIISPSDSIANRLERFSEACKNFESATSLKTVVSPNSTKQYHYSSGTRQQRLEDFDWALNQPEAKAIIFSVGGDTAIELIDGLDYKAIANKRKIISGISDATTILTAITAKTNLITFLGIEFLDYADQDMSYETNSIKDTWFGDAPRPLLPNPNWKDFNGLPTSYTGWRTIRPGKATGRIVGGNDTSYVQLRGSEYFLNPSSGILFIEGYHIPKVQIHKLLEQLKLWGTLDQINGLVIGYYVGSDNPERPGNERPIADIVLEATEGYNFPVMQIGEVGHNVENLILPIGAQIEMDAGRLTLELLEPTTSEV